MPGNNQLAWLIAYFESFRRINREYLPRDLIRVVDPIFGHFFFHILLLYAITLPFHSFFKQYIPNARHVWQLCLLNFVCMKTDKNEPGREHCRAKDSVHNFSTHNESSDSLIFDDSDSEFYDCALC